MLVGWLQSCTVTQSCIPFISTVDFPVDALSVHTLVCVHFPTQCSCLRGHAGKGVWDAPFLLFERPVAVTVLLRVTWLPASTCMQKEELAKCASGTSPVPLGSIRNAHDMRPHPSPLPLLGRDACMHAGADALQVFEQSSCPHQHRAAISSIIECTRYASN